MVYDAVKMKDWQIAEAAEVNMPTPLPRRWTSLEREEENG